MKKILYIAKEQSRIDLNGPLADGLRRLGELTVIENGGHLPKEKTVQLMRGTDILLTIWGSVPVSPEIAEDRGSLQYICNISGTVKSIIPLDIIEAGIPVTNWGDTPAHGVAEGAVTLLLATMKDLHTHIQNVRNDHWKLARGQYYPASLQGLNVGIYGFGVIGRRFAELIRAFGPVIRIFDPYAGDIPDSCTRVGSLDELFSQSEAIVIHAGLTDETTNSVDARLLAMLPDHGIVINTARGGIVDQKALFAELESGRLRAGLDVLADNDRLAPGHPARQWANVIFTSHQISHDAWPSRPGKLNKMDEVCLENVRRFINGEPLLHIMDKTRYMRST